MSLLLDDEKRPPLQRGPRPHLTARHGSDDSIAHDSPRQTASVRLGSESIAIFRQELPRLVLKAYSETLKKLAIGPLKWLLAALAGGVGWLCPDDAERSVLFACCAMVALDTFTGLVAALWTNEAVSSRRFSRVFVKIAGYGSVLVVVGWLNVVLGFGGHVKSALVTGVLWMVFSTEGLSVLENVHRCDLPAPAVVKRLLARIFDAKGGK